MKILCPKNHILNRVTVTADGCWEWKLSLSGPGYGQMRWGGETLAHRCSYRAFHLEGERIPGKLLVCHTCDNRCCVNPEHLFLGTHKDNAADMMQKDRWTAGKVPKGIKQHRARHTDAEVIDAIRRCRAGETHREVAESIGVGKSTVTMWATGKNRRACFDAA